MRALVLAVGRSLAVLAGLAALVVAGLTALVAAGATRSVDREVTSLLQRAASYPLDVLVNAHTYVGVAYVTLPLCLALAWRSWSRGRRAEAAVPLFIAVTGAVELALKLALVHPGPPDELQRVLWRAPATGLPTPSSFPSGHAARLTFLCALAFAATGSTAVRAAAVLFVAFTLFARVYIGDHWASDVAGGAALGILAAALGLLAARALPRIRPSRA